MFIYKDALINLKAGVMGIYYAKYYDCGGGICARGKEGREKE